MGERLNERLVPNVFPGNHYPLYAPKIGVLCEESQNLKCEEGPLTRTLSTWDLRAFYASPGCFSGKPSSPQWGSQNLK